MFSKKTAVAAATLLAAFAAQADVTAYGNIDLGVGRFKAPGDTQSITKVESGLFRESFLGFKGQEDLGGGLKAFFKLETGVAADTGTTNVNGTTFWNRASLIGLQGDFGAVTLGNTRSLGYLVNEAYNPFGDSRQFSVSQRLFIAGNLPGIPGVLAGFNDANWENSVTYMSPNLSGFSAAAQVRLNEKVLGKNDDYGLSLNYTAGPLGLGFFYAKNSINNGTDLKEWQLGSSYDLGMAKLYGQYGQQKVTNMETAKFFQLGAGFPVTTNGTILVSYGENKVKVGGGNIREKQLSLAYDHALSKRTSAYVGLNNARDNSAPVGTSTSGTSVAGGIRHSF